MCLSLLLLLLSSQLIQSASLYNKGNDGQSYVLFCETSLERRIRRSVSNESINTSASTSASRSDRVPSISSLSSSTSSSIVSPLPELLAQFMIDNPATDLLGRQSKIFDYRNSTCWFEYFFNARIPLYTTFTLIENLLKEHDCTINENGLYSLTLTLYSMSSSDDTKVIDAIFKGAMRVYFKDPNCASALIIFTDLGFINCRMKFLQHAQC